jgi:hypothetical protein
LEFNAHRLRARVAAKPKIEHFEKQANGEWLHHVHTGLDAVVVIPSIECTVAADDVYDRVIFPAEPEA